MAGRHHVLLIGIDAYDGGGSLTGCVNDIDAVQRLLVDRVGVARDRIARLVAPRTGGTHQTDVPERLPTLANLRAELERLGSGEVTPGDRVFVYYSGHGTQCIVSAGDGQRFSREALLPKDKVRGPARQFLFDWELNRLIARIAARTPRVTIVLDCCAAGGATRSGLDPEDTRDRFWPSDEVYQLPPDDAGPLGGVRGLTIALGGVAQCQVIAACRDDERARESPGEGDRAHGELTRALLRVLADIADDDLAGLRWGRVWRAVEASVRQANPRQSPWISGSFGRRVFGFGADDDGDPGYAIVAVPEGFRLDVGSLHGVTENAEIAVYGALPPAFPALGSPDDLPARAGRLRVTAAGPASCTAVAMQPFTLPEAPRGRLVKAGWDARLRVRVVPSAARVADHLVGSDLIELVDHTPEVELVRRTDGAWAVTDDIHGTGESGSDPELAIIPDERLDVVCGVLEQYHGYITPIRLARACRDLPSLLQLWILDCNGRSVSGDEAQDPKLPLLEGGARAPYEIGHGDRLCFAVENTADVALSVTLIVCAASGRVQVLGEKRVPARSKHVFWARDTLGAPFTASLAPDRRIGVDRVLAIGTTSANASLQHLRRSTSFADLINPRRTRGAVHDTDKPSSQVPELWTSAMTALRITAVRRRTTDLWIRLTGKPDAFESSTVPLHGEPLGAHHQLAVTPQQIAAVTAWASGGKRWLKRDVDADDLTRVVGVQLFHALFDGPLGDLYAQHRRSSEEVRLRFLTEDAALADLPWEFLHDGHDFLSLTTGSTVVRAFDPRSSPWLPYPPFTAPGRIHVVTNTIDQGFRDRLIAPLRDPAKVSLTVHDATTPAGLDAALEGGDVDVFHLAGHNSSSSGIELSWTDDTGRLVTLGAQALATRLRAAARRPRVVVLHTSQSDGAASVLAATGAAEVVIGVRGDVTEDAVLQFSGAFYASLLGGSPVTRAVTDGRRAIDLHMPGHREWGLFTLYHRAGDVALEPARPLDTPAAASSAQDPTGKLAAMRLGILRHNLATIEQRLRDANGRSVPVLEDQRASIVKQIDELKVQLREPTP